MFWKGGTVLLGVLLGLVPLVVLFSGIIVLRWPVHKAGLLSVSLTMVISFFYSGTSPIILVYGWLYGILIIHKYTLANMMSFILAFYMLSHGCFQVIGNAFRRMPGGVVYKVYFLGFGIAILMLSAGAGIDWIAIVLNQMGIGTWAIPILIDGSCDAFSHFAYLSTPITVPTAVYGSTFGFTEADLAGLIGRFAWAVIPLFGLAILVVLRRDGKVVTWGHAAAVLVYCVSLAAAVNFFLSTVNIMGVGVLVGIYAVAIMLLVNVVGSRLGYLKPDDSLEPMTPEERGRLIRALSPIVIVSVLTSVVSLPWFSSVLERYNFNMPLIADQVIPVQVFQPFVWVMISILLSFLILRPTREKLEQTWGLLVKRLVPFVIATWICSGMVFTYNWSGMVVNEANKLVLPAGKESLNLIHALAIATSNVGPTLYVALVPFMAVFGCMLFGHELTSTLFFTRFHFIAARSLGITRPLVLVAGHMVANLGIVDVRKMMRSLAIIGAYGEEWKTMRFTFVMGLVITLLIIPLLFILF